MIEQANAASVAIFSGDHVLLVARAQSPYQGYWTLPGGRIEAGETSETAARREIGEELGLRLDDLVPVGVFELDGGGYRLAVFAAWFTKGTPHASPEISDWQWCAWRQTGDLKTTPGLAGVLERAATVLP